MTDLDLELLSVPFRGTYFLQMGAELLPLAASIWLAVAFSKTKRDFVKNFLLIYTCTFVVGWATQLWILVLLAFLGALYFTQTKEGD
jgi:hypothetical protein